MKESVGKNPRVRRNARQKGGKHRCCSSKGNREFHKKLSNKGIEITNRAEKKFGLTREGKKDPVSPSEKSAPEKFPSEKQGMGENRPRNLVE